MIEEPKTTVMDRRSFRERALSRCDLGGGAVNAAPAPFAPRTNTPTPPSSGTGSSSGSGFDAAQNSMAVAQVSEFPSDRRIIIHQLHEDRAELGSHGQSVA